MKVILNNSNLFFRMINSSIIRKFSTKNVLNSSNSNIALVLAGCGKFDGSEITEVVSCMIALDKFNAKYTCFSLDRDQAEVINHQSGQKSQEKRNCIDESNRISRKGVLKLEKLEANQFNGLVFPGGFGVAKNLCNFAFKGKNFEVDPLVTKVMEDFNKLSKPIAACCISPILFAKVFPRKRVKITLGKKIKDSEIWPYYDAIVAAEELGVNHEDKAVDEICYDEENMIITSPAFNCATANSFQVYQGIEKMILKLLSLS